MSNTIYVQSRNAPNGWGEYSWENPDSVVAVAEEHALPLLRNPNSGFFQADDYDARPKAKRGRPKKEETVEPDPEPTTGPLSAAAFLGAAGEGNPQGEALSLVTPRGQ